MAIGNTSLAVDGFLSREMAAVLPNDESFQAPKILNEKELFLQNTLASLAFWYREAHKPSAKGGAGGAKWVLPLPSNRGVTTHITRLKKCEQKLG